MRATFESSMEIDFIAGTTTAAVDYLFLSTPSRVATIKMSGLGLAVLSWSCKYFFLFSRGLFYEQKTSWQITSGK